MKGHQEPIKTNQDVKRCFAVLGKRDRRYLLYVVGIQISIGVFDLLSLGLMGTIGALAVSGVQSEAPSRQVLNLLEIFQLDGYKFQSQIAILGMLTASLLVSKTLFSLYFSRRIIFYLSAKGAKVSSELIMQVAKLPKSEIDRFSEQSLLYSIGTGVNVVLIGVIGSLCNLITDFSLLLMLSVVLFTIDPLIALLSVSLFGVTAFFLYIGTRKRALKFGRINSEVQIESNTAILNLFTLYRELTVRNRKTEYVEDISVMRRDLGRAISEINFLPNLSKYILEVTLVLGGFLIISVELLLQDAVGAVGALAVFLTAASRITPALLRVQQSATGIKNSLGMALPTLNILEELENIKYRSLEYSEPRLWESTSEVNPNEIQFKGVSFTYPGSSMETISGLDLEIRANEMIALVGPSGSGKSTLVDLLLGVVKPTHGWIEICGILNSEAIISKDINLGYVPQNVSIIEGTLRENIIFGFKENEFTDLEIWDALEKAELLNELKFAGITLSSRLGSGGQNLSGGQKQRLGIARALLTNPRVLVMDEATSALDSETEEKLNHTIQKMKGSTTLLIIAHRLSSVLNADKVVYLENGKMLASGTFSEVRGSIPDFDTQAKLMGL